jgi:TolB-like protein/Tfp pilus assembly protein PilF
MGNEPRAIYRFDRFTLDLIRGALLAEDGSVLPLRPKSFDLLRHMVVNAGRLMDRDELMQAVWPGVFVTDDSIAQCIKDIRRALDDQMQRILRTVPRRGYLLDVSVSCATPAAAVPPGAMTVGDAPLPTPDANRPMLLVLPFENIGGDPEQRYLADGIADDLVTDLTHYHDLCVVTPAGQRRGSLSAESSDFKVPEAVTYVFAGSLRRSGGRNRVTVRLNDARTGVNIWAERFDRPLDELFALQEELAERLPNYLVTQIERDSIRRARRRPTDSLDAYELCLQGRELHSRATEADTLRARELFARAIEIDPDYAKAYAWQAYTVQRGFTHLWGDPRGRPAAELALALARRAVEIDPDSSFCLGRLAFVLLLNEAWDEALDTARAGVRANPCAAGARFFYGEALTHAGDPAEAEREFRLALSLDPFHPPAWRASLGRALLVAGRLQEALTELRFFVARLPGYVPGLHSLAAAAAEAGEIEEARAAVRSLLGAHPDLTVRRAGDCLFFRDPALTERFRAGLRAGGMPEV